jgi:hypothetical protein
LCSNVGKKKRRMLKATYPADIRRRGIRIMMLK